MIPMLKKELREGELQFGPSAKKARTEGVIFA